MSTPTATMSAPKPNGLEIVYTTLERQDEQGHALKEVVRAMIETKQEMIDLATKTSDRFTQIENTITLRDSECTELQRQVMFKAAELAKDYLNGQEVTMNYLSSKKGQFMRLVYKRIKSRFNVHKYTLVTHVEFARAMQFVNDIKLNDFSEIETRETPKQIELRNLEDNND